MKNIIAAGALAIATSFAAPAFAVTVADGETFCESQGNLTISASSCLLGGNADFPTTISGAPTLTFEGSGTILGFVADDGGPSSNFGDFATIILEKDSIIDFTLLGSEAGIDVAFSFGATAVDILANGTTSFFAAAGTYIFGVDATAPTNSSTRLETSYSLNITAVPLPASGLMLLAGLGAIGVARRRRKKA